MEEMLLPGPLPIRKLPSLPYPVRQLSSPRTGQASGLCSPHIVLGSTERGDSNSEKGSHREDEDQDEITGTTRHVLRPSGLF